MVESLGILTESEELKLEVTGELNPEEQSMFLKGLKCGWTDNQLTQYKRDSQDSAERRI